MSRVQKLR